MSKLTERVSNVDSSIKDLPKVYWDIIGLFNRKTNLPSYSAIVKQ